jgi:hypothetical protein
MGKANGKGKCEHGDGRKHGNNGVYDRSYKADGSPSGYKGDLPFIYYINHPGAPHPRDPKRRCVFSVSCETCKEANEGKDQEEKNYINRNNPEYKKRQQNEQLRECTVGNLIVELIDRLDRQEVVCEDREFNTGDIAIYRRMLVHKAFPVGVPLYDCTIEDGQWLFKDYRDKRLTDNKRIGGIEQEEQTVARGTVKAELGLLWKAFQIAKEKRFFDVCQLMEKNPLDGVTVHMAGRTRFREIEPREEIELAKHLSAKKGPWRQGGKGYHKLE